MHRTVIIGGVVCVLALLAGASGPAVSASPGQATATPALGIPKGMQVEHEAIHTALVGATNAQGQVGVAAKALAEVLHPHFVREEQIALPPLGLLAPLAAGTPLPAAVASDALAMTDTLKAELPRMLEEHGRIRAAVEKLRDAARTAKASAQEQLADDLALHAQSEEDVFYPAAILVGDLIRARQSARPPARE